GVHRSGGSAARMGLGRRVVSMTARAGAPFGRDDALLLEVADHPRREAHRLAGRPDARQLVGLFIEWVAWHAQQSTTTVLDMHERSPGAGVLRLRDRDRCVA